MTMPVSPSDPTTVPIGDTGTGTNAAATTGTASLLQPNTFLNLLVDELRYQNPLDPTNSSDFMNQIASLSQVEQLQTVASSSKISEAAALIGKSVSGNDMSGKTITGVVTGVTNSSSGPILDIGNDEIDMTQVKEIGSTSSPSATPPPTA